MLTVAGAFILLRFFFCLDRLAGENHCDDILQFDQVRLARGRALPAHLAHDERFDALRQSVNLRIIPAQNDI